MKKDRIPALLAYIKALQPNFQIPASDAELSIMVEAWADMLEDLPDDLVKSAVKGHVSASPFPVTIHDIRRQAAAFTKGDDLTELEAWSLVLAAARNSNYNSVAEFEKLPEVVQRAVGSSEILRQWAAMDEDSLGVIQSGFVRSYRQSVTRRDQYACLPVGVVPFRQIKGIDTGKILKDVSGEV